jgi:hypothetical protein
MKRLAGLLLISAGTLPLGGCVAAMALSAANLAVQSARGTPVSNRHLQPQAQDACSKRAAQYGAVNIIDVQQASVSKIIVWGTVDDGKQRQSFECGFGTAITSFKLRPIVAAR